MVDPARRSALPVIPARHVLECGTVVFVGNVAVRIPVQLEDMAEGVLEPKRLAVTEIALDPTDDFIVGGFDCLDPSLQRSRRGNAIGDVPDAGGVMAREL